MDLSRRALQTNGKLFFKFQIRFRIFDWKPKIFQKNSEAWILIKFQCVKYQGICVDKLYKLMESFFFLQILDSFFKLVPIFENK